MDVPRVWELERFAVDAALDRLGLLRVRVGAYRCSPRARHFRARPHCLRPGASYTDRVVAAAVRAVFSDGVSIDRVPDRLARGLRVRLSTSAIRDWRRTYAVGWALDDDSAWIVASFSGVLCVDEVYQEGMSLLLAVDPAAPEGDRLIGDQLVRESVTQAVVDGILTRLRDAGIAPAEVVTDGSALDPEGIAKVWPRAAHQLWLLHDLLSMPAAAHRPPLGAGLVRDLARRRRGTALGRAGSKSIRGVAQRRGGEGAAEARADPGADERRALHPAQSLPARPAVGGHEQRGQRGGVMREAEFL